MQNLNFIILLALYTYKFNNYFYTAYNLPPSNRRVTVTIYDAIAITYTSKMSNLLSSTPVFKNDSPNFSKTPWTGCVWMWMGRSAETCSASNLCHPGVIEYDAREFGLLMDWGWWWWWPVYTIIMSPNDDTIDDATTLYYMYKNSLIPICEELHKIPLFDFLFPSKASKASKTFQESKLQQKPSSFNRPSSTQCIV